MVPNTDVVGANLTIPPSDRLHSLTPGGSAPYMKFSAIFSYSSARGRNLVAALPHLVQGRKYPVSRFDIRAACVRIIKRRIVRNADPRFCSIQRKEDPWRPQGRCLPIGKCLATTY